MVTLMQWSSLQKSASKFTPNFFIRMTPGVHFTNKHSHPSLIFASGHTYKY
jgi:hypothetical protein